MCFIYLYIYIYTYIYYILDTYIYINIHIYIYIYLYILYTCIAYIYLYIRILYKNTTIYIYINAFVNLALKQNIFLEKCSQIKECLFSKEQNIQSRNRKFILLIIKSSGKELPEITKEYENGSKVKFQTFWRTGKSACLNNSESTVVA